MKKPCFMRILTVLFLFFVLLKLNAQNIVITDNESYSGHSSAMLDVESTTKGLLIPRLTTAERTTLGSTAAIGLLVFDVDESVFYYYDSSGWVNISKGQLWTVNSNQVLLTNSDAKVGIGTNTPNSKLEVQADASFTDSDTLFAVKDNSGNIVFAVFPDGAKVYVNKTTKGKVGGFAVSGRNPAKANEQDYLLITPDSTRVYFNDTIGAKGKVGGFAVSGRNPAKSDGSDYLVITSDSTRFYINDTIKAKGKVGGFAVSGRNPAKGISSEILLATADSTRIYVNETNTKGKVGGFAVSGRNPAKGSISSYMKINKENYLIGLNAGDSITTGLYNSFLGYYTGARNSEGTSNVFLGYNTGFSNIDGSYNVFLGSNAGYNSLNGEANVFIGQEAAYNGTDGDHNVVLGYQAMRNYTETHSSVIMGYKAGFGITESLDNVYIGSYAGSNAVVYNYENVVIGTSAGRSNTGSQNVILGNNAGYNNSGTKNVIIGESAGYNNAGVDNLILGHNAGYSNTSGSYNVFLGNVAGRSNSIGERNVFIGDSAGYKGTDSKMNVFIGYRAGVNNVSGDGSVIIGQEAGINYNGGHYNVFIGQRAGRDNVTGYANIMLGTGTGFMNLGNYNTLIGYYAGGNNVNGKYNVMLGDQAGRSSDGDYNVYLGRGAGYNETEDYRLYIESTSNASYNSASNSLIYGEFDNNFLRVNGTLTVKNPSNANTELVLDGNSSKHKQIVFNEGGDYKAGFGWSAANDYIFLYEGGEVSFASKGGEIGIGTSTPAYKLDVVDNVSSSSGGYFVRFKNEGGNLSDGIKIEAGDNNASGSGYNDIIYLYCADGDGSWVGSIYGSNGTLMMNGKSASPAKNHDIKNTNSGLNIINQLSVVDYDFNSKLNTHKTGFVGEDAVKVFPAMVSVEKETGEYGVANSALVPVLTKAIQEQQEQIEKLQTENQELKQQLNQIIKMLEKNDPVSKDQ